MTRRADLPEHPPGDESSGRRLFRNALHAFRGDGGSAAINALCMAVLARSVGPASFGVFVFILGYAELVARLTYPRSIDALIRFGLDRNGRVRKRRLTRVAALCARIDQGGLILGCVIALACLPILLHLGELSVEQTHTAVVLCLCPLAWSADATIGVFRLVDRFAVYARIQLVGNTCRLMVFVALYLVNAPLSLFALAFLLTGLAIAVAKHTAAHQLLGAPAANSSSRPIRLARARKMGLIQFLIEQYLNHILRAVPARLDVVALGLFASDVVVAHYRVATYICGLVGTIASPLATAFYPEAAAITARRRYSEAARLAKIIWQWSLAYSFLVCCVFAAVGQWALGVAFGPGFEPAYGLTLLMMVATGLSMLCAPVHSMLLALGLSRALLWIQLGAVIVFTVTLLRATPTALAFGPIAAHVAYFAVWLLLAISLVVRQPDLRSRTRAP